MKNNIQKIYKISSFFKKKIRKQNEILITVSYSEGNYKPWRFLKPDINNKVLEQYGEI